MKGRPRSVSADIVQAIRSRYAAAPRLPNGRRLPWVKVLARELQLAPRLVRNIAERESYYL